MTTCYFTFFFFVLCVLVFFKQISCFFIIFLSVLIFRQLFLRTQPNRIKWKRFQCFPFAFQPKMKYYKRIFIFSIIMIVWARAWPPFWELLSPRWIRSSVILLKANFVSLHYAVTTTHAILNSKHFMFIKKKSSHRFAPFYFTPFTYS